jgi:hypothetical protein
MIFVAVPLARITVQGHWLAQRAHNCAGPLARPNMASGAVMEMRPVITNVHIKNWVPECVMVDDKTFVCLNKWDRLFARFCTGQGLDLRKGARKNINVKFIEVLQRKRTEACDLAVHNAIAVDQDGHRRKRARKARMSDRDIVDAYMEVNMPCFNRGELVVHAVAMKMLFGIKNSAVWVELLPEHLEYIRHGVLHSIEQQELGTRRWKKRIPQSETVDDDPEETLAVDNNPEEDAHGEPAQDEGTDDQDDDDADCRAEDSEQGDDEGNMQNSNDS